MRELSEVEVDLVSAGQNQGWTNYTTPMKLPDSPFYVPPGGGPMEHSWNRVSDPIGTFAALLDYYGALTYAQEHNRRVAAVNRDRNGDGVVTDAERQANWNDYETDRGRELDELKRNPPSVLH